MSEKQRPRIDVMQIIRVVGLILLILGIVGMVLFSSRELSVAEIIAIIAAAAGALGFGSGAFKKDGGNGSAAGGGIALLLASAVLSSGCGAFQPSPSTTDRARAVIAQGHVLVDAVDELVPADAEGREEAFEFTRNGLDAGELAAGGSWTQSVSRGIDMILAVVEACGVELPPWLRIMISVVSTALLALLALFGVSA